MHNYAQMQRGTASVHLSGPDAVIKRATLVVAKSSIAILRPGVVNSHVCNCPERPFPIEKKSITYLYAPSLNVVLY